MPIYAYRCSTCGHAKDVLQKISDPLLTECPSCGAATFQKQVTAAGFQLKGSGWYVTDFRGGAGASKKDGKDADSPAAEGKPADAKTSDTTSGDAKAAPADAKPASPAKSAGDAAASPAPASPAPPASAT